MFQIGIGGRGGRNFNGSGSQTPPPTIETGSLVEATGGEVIDYTDGNGHAWRAHKFSASGTFNVQKSANVEVLLVAGGGGTGGGGGGAGGVIATSVKAPAGVNTIVIGAGGIAGYGSSSANTNRHGRLGTDSSAFGLTALGGGGGLGATTAASPWENGASGGGRFGHSSGWSGAAGIALDETQGNDGGYTPTYFLGGGGGGFSSAGGTAVSGVGGDGGEGFQSEIEGALKYYACGGPGGANSGNGHTPGIPAVGGADNSEAGKPNTGNGAGGAFSPDGSNQAGGSGVCIIRYRTDLPLDGNKSEIEAMGGTETEFTDGEGQSWRVHTFTTTGSLDVSATGEAEMLLVGSGGSAGALGGGGGGAGIFVSGVIEVSAGSHPIILGAGGVGGQMGGNATSTIQHGLKGSDTSALGYVMPSSGCGRGGGTTGYGDLTAKHGPSGGGGASSSNWNLPGGRGQWQIGNNGGDAVYSTVGGSGGTISAPGNPGTSTVAGDAVEGRLINFDGTAKVYGCSGAGGAHTGVGNTPGAASANSAGLGEDGQINTGNGGASGTHSAGSAPSAGNGGSGIVQIRYKI